MQDCSYAVGQAVFIRTDAPDYSEETIPFKNLEELTALCAQPRENLTLDRLIIYSMAGEAPCAVTLGFLAASVGRQASQEQLR